MNVPTIFLVIFMIIGAAMVLFLIGGTSNTTPIDSQNNTVPEHTNETTGNATSIMKTGSAVAPWIAVILVVIVLCGVFLWAISKGGSGGYGRSRYQ